MAATLGTAAIVTAGAVSAHGLGGGFGGGMGINSNLTPAEFSQNQQKMFESQAALIGASVEEIKTAWASGIELPELAKQKGITEEQLRAKMQEQMLQNEKTRLQDLVTNGVITQAQADQRLSVIQKRAANAPKGGMGMRGHRMQNQNQAPTNGNTAQ